MSRCSLSDNASIATTSLYEHYKLEGMDKGQEPDLTLKEFSEKFFICSETLGERRLEMAI